jgi:hypothetical protein
MNIFKIFMPLKFRINLVCLLLFVSLCPSHSSTAQNSSVELWPEADIWYRLNPSWRLSSLLSITKYNESSGRDLNIFLQADYAWGKTKLTLYRKLVNEEEKQRMKVFMVRGGIMKGWSIGENASDYTENMLYTEFHKRIPLKRNILLSHRFRIDTRCLSQESNFSYRFRYRIMLEKEFKTEKSSIVPFVNVEPYWDSRYSKVTRARVIGGATVSRGSYFALESNLTYQYDQTYGTENLYALNIILHVFLEKK